MNRFDEAVTGFMSEQQTAYDMACADVIKQADKAIQLERGQRLADGLADLTEEEVAEITSRFQSLVEKPWPK